MTPTRAELIALFDSYSDEALQQRAQAGVLTEMAQELAEEELRRRGLPLHAPLPVPEVEPAASDVRLEPSRVVPGYLLIGRAPAGEVQGLRMQLEAYGIPVLLPRDAGSHGEVRLEVPAESARQARALLAQSRVATLVPPWSPADWFDTDRLRLREVAAVGMVLLWGFGDLLIEGASFLHAALADPLIDASAWWPALLPLLMLAAGLLLFARSKWAIFVLMVHLVASVAIGVLHRGDAAGIGAGLYGGAFSGLVIYYSVYLLGAGRLR